MTPNEIRHHGAARQLVLAGLFTSLVAVGTLVSFPIAGGHGYVNLGDAVIFICAYFIGGLQCAVVSALGSAIADVSLGFFIYAPGTFIIKGLMAAVCGFLIRRIKFKPLAILVSGLIMPVGYFLYETLLSALGAWSFSAAVIDLPWNFIQYAFDSVVAVIAIISVERLNTKRG